MRIAYFTTDLVNYDLAVDFAARHRGALDMLSLQDHWQEGEYDALLYDADYLPFETWPTIRAHLLATRYRLPVALHSHRLPTEELIAFRIRGIVTSRTLEARIFKELSKLIDHTLIETTIDSELGRRTTVAEMTSQRTSPARSTVKIKSQTGISHPKTN